MARRTIGQEGFCFTAGHQKSELDALSELIDWHAVDALMAPVAAAVKGEQGTLVDATIIASASKDDEEARWIKHKKRKAVHGYKAHVACAEDTALIEQVKVTPANVNDGRAGGAIIAEDPGDVYADSAYRGPRFRDAVEARGGRAHVVATTVWARDEEDGAAKLKAINGPIHKVRGRIEKIFGTCKEHYGLRRMAHRGIVKATLQVMLTAIACNLKRGLDLQRA